MPGVSPEYATPGDPNVPMSPQSLKPELWSGEPNLQEGHHFRGRVSVIYGANCLYRSCMGYIVPSCEFVTDKVTSDGVTFQIM